MGPRLMADHKRNQRVIVVEDDPQASRVLNTPDRLNDCKDVG